MDLKLNVHDEPRVVVSYKQLYKSVINGYTAQSTLNGKVALFNNFSISDDLLSHPIPEVFTSRFLNIER